MDSLSLLALFSALRASRRGVVLGGGGGWDDATERGSMRLEMSQVHGMTNSEIPN